MLKAHLQAWIWQDEWHGLTMEVSGKCCTTDRGHLTYGCTPTRLSVHVLTTVEAAYNDGLGLRRTFLAISDSARSISEDEVAAVALESDEFLVKFGGFLVKSDDLPFKLGHFVVKLGDLAGGRNFIVARSRLGMDRADSLRVSGYAGWEAEGFGLARGPDLKSKISHYP